jgi:hypothetical protein
MKYALMLSMAIALAVASPSHATKPISAIARNLPAGECTLKENVSLTVSFNRRVKSFSEAKSIFDEQMKKVEDFAVQQKIGKLVVQSQNYNVSAQPVGYSPDGVPDSYNYQVNGSVNYLMHSADAAFKFGEFLTQNKIQVSLSSNAYRQGNCQNMLSEGE